TASLLRRARSQRTAVRVFEDEPGRLSAAKLLTKARRGVSRRISPSCRSFCGSKSLYFPEAPISVVDYDTNAIAVKACTKTIKPDVHACVRIGIDLSQLMALRKLGHLVDIQPGPQPTRRHKAKTLRQTPRNQQIGE